MEKLFVFDTTLRDGEQSPGCSMNFEEKLKMAQQLAALNVDVIEAGFPIASEGDFEAVRQVSRQIDSCVIAGLARAKSLDIERAWDAVKSAKRPRIHTFIATSDVHLKYKLKKTRKEVLTDAVAAVTLAKSFCEDVEFSCEDAVRTDREYLCDVYKAVIDAGATVINVPDTVGYSLPDEFGGIIQMIKTQLPNIGGVTISVHCHNDLGLAVANSLAGIANGARQVECTINGIGERAGNAALEEIVMAVNTRHDLLPYLTCDVTAKEIYKSSQLLSHITGNLIPRNKAIVGKNAFAHEAGIHQDGVLKRTQTYEIMTPQSVGIPRNEIVLGKHSGRHALGKYYQDLGYTVTKEQLERTYKLFTKIADKKKEVLPEDLLAILHDEITEIPAQFILKNLQVTSGSNLMPTATVELQKGDEILQDSATGDGPVDAACRAIERVTGVTGRLVDYNINATTQGKDAVGEAVVRVLIRKREYIGRAVSTDVVEASASAYLDAVNRALYSFDKIPVSQNTKEVAVGP